MNIAVAYANLVLPKCLFQRMTEKIFVRSERRKLRGNSRSFLRSSENWEKVWRAIDRKSRGKRDCQDTLLYSFKAAYVI